MANVSAMRKEEARAYLLEEFGEEAPKEWTNAEIKERIQQHRRLLPNSGKNRSLGVSMKSRKSEIQRKCLEESIPVQEKDTKAALMIKLRARKKEEEEAILVGSVSEETVTLLHPGRSLPPGRRGGSSTTGTKGVSSTSVMEVEESHKKKGDNLQEQELAEAKKELHRLQ